MLAIRLPIKPPMVKDAVTMENWVSVIGMHVGRPYATLTVPSASRQVKVL